MYPFFSFLVHFSSQSTFYNNSFNGGLYFICMEISFFTFNFNCKLTGSKSPIGTLKILFHQLWPQFLFRPQVPLLVTCLFLRSVVRSFSLCLWCSAISPRQFFYYCFLIYHFTVIPFIFLLPKLLLNNIAFYLCHPSCLISAFIFLIFVSDYCISVNS